MQIQQETPSSLLDPLRGNDVSSMNGPHKGPVMRSVDSSCVFSFTKPMKEQLNCWRFKVPCRSHEVVIIWLLWSSGKQMYCWKDRVPWSFARITSRYDRHLKHIPNGKILAHIFRARATHFNYMYLNVSQVSCCKSKGGNYRSNLSVLFHFVNNRLR